MIFKKELVDWWTKPVIALRERITKHVLANSEMSFHYESRTSIVFYLPEPRVKGFGDWPDQAHAQFESRLKERMAQATRRNLSKWGKEIDARRAMDLA